MFGFKKKKDKQYNVWQEGFQIQGMSEPCTALWLGTVLSTTFADACETLCGDFTDYDPLRKTVWGCRLFDNEKDARKSFG